MNTETPRDLLDSLHPLDLTGGAEEGTAEQSFPRGQVSAAPPLLSDKQVLQTLAAGSTCRYALPESQYETRNFCLRN